MEVGFQVQVGQGVVARPGGAIRFAGSYVFAASEDEAVRVEIAVWDEASAEFDVSLREGETFEVAGQTWRLDKIHSQGVRRWYADLTRIA